MFKDRAKRIQMFEGSEWGTGVQMAQLAVDGIHLVSYWDHTTTRYSILMIGGDSDRVRESFARWTEQNLGVLGRASSPDTILDAFYEFYRQERREHRNAETTKL